MLAGSSVQPGVGRADGADQRPAGRRADHRDDRRGRPAGSSSRAAYAHCAAIAARHGKSYHLATRLLTPDRRPAVHALYAAARTADDLVDLPGADPAGDLADWSAGAAGRAGGGLVRRPGAAGAGAHLPPVRHRRRAPRRLPGRDDQRPRRHRLRRPRRPGPVHVGLGGGHRPAGAAGPRHRPGRAPRGGRAVRHRARRGVPAHQLPARRRRGRRPRPGLPARRPDGRARGHPRAAGRPSGSTPGSPR